MTDEELRQLSQQIDEGLSAQEQDWFNLAASPSPADITDFVSPPDKWDEARFALAAAIAPWYSPPKTEDIQELMRQRDEALIAMLGAAPAAEFAAAAPNEFPTAAEEEEIDEAYMDFASWLGAEMVRNPEGQYPAPSMPPLPVFDKDTVDAAVARIKNMWSELPEEPHDR